MPSSNDPTKNVNFRAMLLTKCQKEFDNDYTKDVDIAKLKEGNNKNGLN